jgi:hypothetical protein
LRADIRAAVEKRWLVAASGTPHLLARQMPVYGDLLPLNQFSKSRIDCSKSGRYSFVEA